jgi:transposase-like protein
MPRGTPYTSEFRRETVKLVKSSNKPAAVIANELGVNPKTLYSWLKQDMTIKNNKNNTSKNNNFSIQELEKENLRLKRELKRLEMERDILKKAAAYFASLEL